MPQLAQINIARMIHDPDSPEMADFTREIEPVNALADDSPGFRWRLASDAESSLALEAFEAAGWLVNMSVWDSLDALKTFVRQPRHLDVMKQRARWFDGAQSHLCLWWVPDGHIPRFEEAMDRLEHLREHGPTPHAFTFSNSF